MQCQKHRNNDFMFVCSQCNHELVCSLCLVDSHNGHRIATFEDTGKSIKTKLQKIASDTDEVLQNRRQILDFVRKEKEDNEEASKKIGKQIENRRKGLHKIVDELADELLSECEAEREKNWKLLHNQDLTISEQISKASKHSTKIKEVMEEKSEIKVIQSYKEISHLSLEEISHQATSQLHFTEGAMTKDYEQIREVFGTVSNNPVDVDKSSDLLDPVKPVRETSLSQPAYQGSGYPEALPSVKELSSFQYSQCSLISRIRKSCSSTCWVKLLNDTELKVIHETGHIMRSVKIEASNVRGFHVSENGTLHVACKEPNCIKQVDCQTGKEQTLISTGALMPSDVCCTPTGDLLVLLTDGVVHTIPQNSKGCLMKYNNKDKELIKVMTNKSSENIFNHPNKMSVNQQGDRVAVLNQDANKINVLILLDEKLTVKLQYLGPRRVLRNDRKIKLSEIENFFIRDVQFDSSGNIWLCEEFSRSIQYLSPQCDILTTLFTDDVHAITFTLVNEDKLWVGRYDGRIKILKSFSG